MRLIVARHCQTDWNARHKIQGCTDIPLNDAGRAEAAALAERLAGEGVTCIVTSDLSRARETSAIVAARLGVRVDVDERLRECSFGIVEGMPFGLFQVLFGSMHGKTPEKRLRYDFRPFGGELGALVALRYLGAVFDIVRRGPPDATVMIVAHGRGLRTFLAALRIERSVPAQGDYIVVDL